MGRYLDIARAAAAAEGHAPTASALPGEHYSGRAKSDISAESLVPALEAVLPSGADGVDVDRKPEVGVREAPDPDVDMDVPEAPEPWPGHVVELTLRDGRWSWRQHRVDDADRAWAAYVAGGRRQTAEREG